MELIHTELQWCRLHRIGSSFLSVAQYNYNKRMVCGSLSSVRLLCFLSAQDLNESNQSARHCGPWLLNAVLLLAFVATVWPAAALHQEWLRFISNLRTRRVKIRRAGKRLSSALLHPRDHGRFRARVGVMVEKYFYTS